MRGRDTNMGMDKQQDGNDIEDGPATYTTGMDSETTVSTVAPAATPRDHMVHCAYCAVQRTTKKRTYTRLYELPAASQVENVPTIQKEGKSRELSKCH
jgi:hypothetical protein